MTRPVCGRRGGVAETTSASWRLHSRCLRTSCQDAGARGLARITRRRSTPPSLRLRHECRGHPSTRTRRKPANASARSSQSSNPVALNGVAHKMHSITRCAASLAFIVALGLPGVTFAYTLKLTDYGNPIRWRGSIWHVTSSSNAGPRKPILTSLS